MRNFADFMNEAFSVLKNNRQQKIGAHDAADKEKYQSEQGSLLEVGETADEMT